MKDNVKIGLALLAMYFIWGSTYLVVRLAIEFIPPFLLTGTRLLLAGGLLFVYLWWQGVKFPTGRQWLNAGIVGGLMLGGGVGGTAYAEQWVESGLAAVIIATMPLWATIMASFWEKMPAKLEWLGLAVGFIGVILLNLEGNLQANPFGTAIMFIAPMLWAFGSVLSRRIELPTGSMAFAAEMLGGGALLMVMSLITRETLTETPPMGAIMAWLYLSIFGSLIAYSSYMFLLQKTRITVATSYAYVNPIVAVLLGVTLAGETISAIGIIAMAVILVGVLIIGYATHTHKEETTLATATD